MKQSDGAIYLSRKEAARWGAQVGILRVMRSGPRPVPILPLALSVGGLPRNSGTVQGCIPSASVRRARPHGPRSGGGTSCIVEACANSSARTAPN